jgi:hypothetical protein
LVALHRLVIAQPHQFTAQHHQTTARLHQPTIFRLLSTILPTLTLQPDQG